MVSRMSSAMPLYMDSPSLEPIYALVIEVSSGVNSVNKELVKFKGIPIPIFITFFMIS